MLNDDHGVAAPHELLEYLDEFLHIFMMKTDRRLVEEINRFHRHRAIQLARNLHSLCFSSRERCCALPNSEIFKPGRVQSHQTVIDGGNIAEKLFGLFNRHLQYFINIFPTKSYLERFFHKTLPLAHVTGDIHRRQEVHLYRDRTIPLARFAAAAGDVE